MAEKDLPPIASISFSYVTKIEDKIEAFTETENEDGLHIFLEYAEPLELFFGLISEPLIFKVDQGSEKAKGTFSILDTSWVLKIETEEIIQREQCYQKIQAINSELVEETSKSFLVLKKELLALKEKIGIEDNQIKLIKPFLL